LFTIRLRVIIAVSQHSVNTIYDFFEIKNLYDRLWKDSAFLKKIYLFIMLIKFIGNCFSPLTRYKRLKKVLLNKLNYLRQIKFYYRFLFSANYFAAFFNQALYYTSQSIFQPFNFIYASRKNNLISSNYNIFFINFLELAYKTKLPYKNITRFITLIIIINIYPPRMYSKCLIEK